MSPFFVWKMGISWSDKFAEFNSKIASDGYQLFSIFFGMMLLKGILSSIAGPAPTYDMQKILSTKSPREASKMSGFVSVVLLIYSQIKEQITVAGSVDLELILPAVIPPPGYRWALPGCCQGDLGGGST